MNHPILIVGSGLSGMMAAIRLCEQGFPVTLISQNSPLSSNSALASGGLNVLVAPEKHFTDTLKVGGFLANQELVKQMCFRAPEIVNYLERLGVSFNRTAEGFLERCQLPGMDDARAVMSGHTIGLQIVQALRQQLRRFENTEKLKQIQSCEFISLIKNSPGEASGVLVMDKKTLEIESIFSQVVLMATGGYAGLYENSKNHPSVDGSAISTLYQQGAALANPDLIQFSSEGYASLGGLWIDENHQTSIPNLFAAGDCEYQYHGSYRQPGNGLLAALYAGMRAASSMIKSLASRLNASLDLQIENERNQEAAINQEWFDRSGPENCYSLASELSENLALYAGDNRKQSDLKKLKEFISELKNRIQHITLRDRSSFANQELFFARRLKNRIFLAEALASSALLRHQAPAFKTTKVFYRAESVHVEYEDVLFKYLQPSEGGLI